MVRCLIPVRGLGDEANSFEMCPENECVAQIPFDAVCCRDQSNIFWCCENRAVSVWHLAGLSFDEHGFAATIFRLQALCCRQVRRSTVNGHRLDPFPVESWPPIQGNLTNEHPVWGRAVAAVRHNECSFDSSVSGSGACGVVWSSAVASKTVCISFVAEFAKTMNANDGDDNAEEESSHASVYAPYLLISLFASMLSLFNPYATGKNTCV
jgi:hypothetical protein